MLTVFIRVRLGYNAVFSDDLSRGFVLTDNLLGRGVVDFQDPVRLVDRHAVKLSHVDQSFSNRVRHLKVALLLVGAAVCG